MPSLARELHLFRVKCWLLCVVFVVLLSAAECRRRHVAYKGSLKKGSYFSAEHSERRIDREIKVIDAGVIKSAFDNGKWRGEHLRWRRAAATDDPVDPNNRTTVANLTDSHTTLMVHWAGEGSNVIMALAKNSDQTDSALFISKNYGKTFSDVSNKLIAQWDKKAVIGNYYSSRLSNNHYVFTDEINDCMFTTDDSGDNFNRVCSLPFSPRVVQINPVNPHYILAMDDQSQLKELYLTKDFGVTWEAVYSNVKSFFWGIPPYDNGSTIYVVVDLAVSHMNQTSGLMRVIKSESMFQFSYEIVQLISDVVYFQVQDNYMYATKSVNLLGARYNPHLQFWVSYNRNDFVRAEFPGNYVFTDFYVADASEGQLMVCASINNSYSNLYVSDVTGYKFILSLPRIVYFNPKSNNNRNYIRQYAKEVFADITKIHGVSGIYIASQQTNDTLEIEEQQTLITYDKGGTWQMIKAPSYLIGNQASNCSLAKNCSLHLTQEFHRIYPGSQSYPILSQHSSPGLVIASGVLGNSLKGDPDVFVSANAGITWRQALIGNYVFASGDHGGIIVAARVLTGTNQIVYSIDEGETWHTYRIVRDPIRIYGLLTEPGENKTIFSVFGSGMYRHSWQIIQVDLKDAFNRSKCGSMDYTMWSVSEDLPQQSCLLGHVTSYQRRRAHANCYNGGYFVRESEVTNCTCHVEDFECDFGFVKVNGSCQRDMTVSDAETYNIPSDCSPGSFYSYTRGYRKVAGDTCVGGVEHRYGPLRLSCPIQERKEFLLLTLDGQLKIIDLATSSQTVLLYESVAHVPAIFDYEMNCVMYVEMAGNIKRTCLSAQNISSSTFHETIYMKESDADVTSMSFDWTGKNIYFTDSNNSIHVVNVPNRFQRTIYTASNGVHNPRAIIVDPHHGYLFFVGRESSTSQNYSIFRATMDGSSTIETLVNKNVTSGTSLTIDLNTETLYWVTSGSGYKSDITNNSVNIWFHKLDYYLEPSSIAIYKNEVYMGTNYGYGIIAANKNNPSVWRYFSFQSSIHGMLVVSNTSQHAFSACSSYNTQCSQLCLPCPGVNSHNRTCRCGDGFTHTTRNSSFDETCGCVSGETMTSNNTCVKASNSSSCSSGMLTCHNGRCIHSTWKCDGDNDCGDASDEIDCPYTTCSSSYFTCRSGKCIPQSWKCDQQDDCHDGFQSDELGCANRTCSSNQFRCSNDYCISVHWVCDSDNDCYDNSDEMNCEHHNRTSCPPWYFTCDNGACIDSVYQCNGYLNCIDGSDEKNCSAHNCNPVWQFDCGSHSNRCIVLNWVCDGVDDCGNGADEKNCAISTARPTTVNPLCPFDSYTCRNGRCVGMEVLCNNFNDCGDFSDERDCMQHITTSMPHTCRYDQFFCPVDYRCLNMSLRCDQHEDCRDGSDEENCETTCAVYDYQCTNGQCIHHTWVCDGEFDCNDKDDESFCNNHTVICTDSEFQCLMDGTCLPRSMLCNKVVDCEDGSDEVHCEYHGKVNCSNFNNAKEACCTNSDCGVFRAARFIFENSECQSIDMALETSIRNDCDGLIPVTYNCKPNQFKCGDRNKTCLSLTQVCDVTQDCINGQDEQNCGICANLRPVPDVVNIPTNTTISLRIGFNFTTMSYAENVPRLIRANLTWINKESGSTIVIDKLKPFTTYYFAFLKSVGNVTCVLSSQSVTTDEGIPSAPSNVTAVVHIESYPINYVVDVSWRKPSLPNGIITAYTIYYQEVDTNGKKKGQTYTFLKRIYLYENWQDSLTVRIQENIKLNTSYIFWVDAQTKAGNGPSSETATVNVIPVEDLKITVANITDTSLTLNWIKSNNGIGYKINVNFPDGEFLDYAPAKISPMVLFVNKTQTSIVVDGLCPGTKVKVGLQVMYPNNVTGPELLPVNTTQTSGEIHLKGIQPEVKFTSVDSNEMYSILVHYKLTKGGPVKQYYVYYSYDEINSNLLVSNSQSSYELSVKYACQKYTIWIRPAYETCPFTDKREQYTEYDERSSPKSLSANVTLTNYHYNLNLTWKPACGDLSSIPVHYIVTVATGDTKEKQSFEVKNNSFYLLVQDGTNYTFTVRTSFSDSLESDQYRIFIPYVGKPYNIITQVNRENNVVIRWQFPPASDQVINFRRFVVKIKRANEEIVNYVDKANMVSKITPSTEFQLNVQVPKMGEYIVSITAESVSGHTIGETGTYELMVEMSVKSANTGDISISKTNLVAILVPVGLIVIVLSAALVIFTVRHKRLQRSFLAFANSHYNIQSGTTTFSEDLGLDGDEPIIQGFSDDEPLVIA